MIRPLSWGVWRAASRKLCWSLRLSSFISDGGAGDKGCLIRIPALSHLTGANEITEAETLCRT